VSGSVSTIRPGSSTSTVRSSVRLLGLDPFEVRFEGVEATLPAPFLFGDPVDELVRRLDLLGSDAGWGCDAGSPRSTPACCSCLSTDELAWPQAYRTAHAASTNRTRTAMLPLRVAASHMVHVPTRASCGLVLKRLAPVQTSQDRRRGWGYRGVLWGRCVPVSASGSTLSKLLRKLGFSPKKRERGCERKRRVPKGSLARSGLREAGWEALRVLKDECPTNTSLSPIYGWSRRGKRFCFEVPR
jgi:hypothetical protein